MILWDPRIEAFVSNSLSPAQSVKVKYYQNGVEWSFLESEIEKGAAEKETKEDGSVEYKYEGFVFVNFLTQMKSGRSSQILQRSLYLTNSFH